MLVLFGSKDDAEIARAWAAARERYTDAELRVRLLEVDTDDGTLRADLALLAPELDVLPTGSEGPGGFQWVRQVAGMKREAVSLKVGLDQLDHWHDGGVAKFRQLWDGFVISHPPYDYTGGVALHHLVVLNSYMTSNREGWVWNDGIPFTLAYYRYQIARRILMDTHADRRSVVGVPPVSPSWADRCLIAWLWECFAKGPRSRPREVETRWPAIRDAYRAAVRQDDQSGWLGWVSAPLYRDVVPDGVWPNDLIWMPAEERSPLLEGDTVVRPPVDWAQWAAAGLCLVAVGEADFTRQFEPRFAPADELGIPVLLLTDVKSDGERGELRLWLCLPGQAPIDFGKVAVPMEVDPA